MNTLAQTLLATLDYRDPAPFTLDRSAPKHKPNVYEGPVYFAEVDYRCALAIAVVYPSERRDDVLNIWRMSHANGRRAVYDVSNAERVAISALVLRRFAVCG